MEEKKIIPEPRVQSAPSPSALPGPVSLLTEAWELYKRRYKTFLKVSFLGLFAYALTIGVLFVFAFVGVIAVTIFKLPTLMVIILAIIGAIIAIAAYFMLIGLLSWSHLSLLYTIKFEESGWKEAFIKTKGIVIQYLILTIFLMLIILGGYGLFVIPGILLSFWFSQAVYVYFDQGKRGLEAMFISKQYVQGKFWALFGRYIVLGFVIGGLQIPFSMASSFLQSSDAPWGYSFAANIIGNILSFVVLTPLSLIYNYLIYTYLKKEHPNVSVTVTKNDKMKYGAIAVVGILVPIAFFALFAFIIFITGTTATKYSHDTKRQSDVYNLQGELEKYYIDFGSYPSSLTDLTVQDNYLLPTDPKTHEYYPYTVGSDGQTYELCPQYEKYTYGCVTNMPHVEKDNFYDGSSVPPATPPTFLRVQPTLETY